ncbi:hypothetical protein UFOVP1095_35 [uncultured Caudovirales phage]|uniref:Uncharacterized protein n=1 Tax=uncultured Caudovirales phage TaxID=2100421 RepID=A0A6J5PQ93_9CAUD|nr:hypothetical protein UFOVP918_35 [uncultured Caudovirales phage]CAB4182704.1 hypothetical protein UFOVP1095_35 [uncultured Caudovirales phage]CAB4214246.1 hypothetical protein UFOVP1452_35 [uncultured Caudovirales phage]CAB5228313.1 hypothetical protein UFOVP1540_12 [uncultured Caudovirales phage]
MTILSMMIAVILLPFAFKYLVKKPAEWIHKKMATQAGEQR